MILVVTLKEELLAHTDNTNLNVVLPFASIQCVNTYVELQLINYMLLTVSSGHGAASGGALMTLLKDYDK